MKFQSVPSTAIACLEDNAAVAVIALNTRSSPYQGKAMLTLISNITVLSTNALPMLIDTTSNSPLVDLTTWLCISLLLYSLTCSGTKTTTAELLTKFEEEMAYLLINRF